VFVACYKVNFAFYFYIYKDNNYTSVSVSEKQPQSRKVRTTFLKILNLFALLSLPVLTLNVLNPVLVLSADTLRGQRNRRRPSS